jgi:hypothetical protein
VVVQHNKQREAWHRFREKNPRLAAKIEAKAATAADEGLTADTESEGTSDASSDDEEEVCPDDLPLCCTVIAAWNRVISYVSCTGGQSGEEELEEVQFLSVLNKIKQRDRSIYDSDVFLFTENGAAEDGGKSRNNAESGARKEKPAYLKDVLARQVGSCNKLSPVLHRSPHSSIAAC